MVLGEMCEAGLPRIMLRWNVVSPRGQTTHIFLPGDLDLHERLHKHCLFQDRNNYCLLLRFVLLPACLSLSAPDL